MMKVYGSTMNSYKQLKIAMKNSELLRDPDVVSDTKRFMELFYGRSQHPRYSDSYREYKSPAKHHRR